MTEKKSKENGCLKFIDLFAGIGGFRLALKQFGEECVFSSDFDKNSQKVYRDNFQETPKGDITKIKAEEIPPHDVLCAGFPCQPFSVSGNREGFNDINNGNLFFDIERVAKFHKPKVIFLENVGHLEKHENGKTLKIISRTLEEIGYDLFHKVLDSSDYGVPQHRKRIYMVAFRKDLGVSSFEFPKPTMKEVKLKSVLEPNSKAKNQIIDETVPKAVKIENGWKVINKYTGKTLYKYKSSDAKKKAFAAVKRGNLHPIRFHNRKNIRQSGLKTIRVGTIGKGGQGERIYSVDGHSATLTATTGGIASKTQAYLVNGKVRKLTPLEFKRLMGFPDDFKMDVIDGTAYTLLGNSVVIPVLKLIYKEIKASIYENVKN